MAQPPVHAVNRETALPFPFNLRPLMAGWNALFHSNSAFTPDKTKSALWNRGAYLVESLGHCGACHTPRNALGAEKDAKAYLAGGLAEGWEAPPLTSSSHAPIPWSEDELFAYLRTGHSRFHGVAAGPMAPVVKELTALPDTDIRAMAHYIASFNTIIDGGAQEALAARIEAATTNRDFSASQNGARIYDGACAVCHSIDGPRLFGVRPSLALNSNLHSATPDNLIQVILHGINAPVSSDLGYMPAFKHSLNPGQIADLVIYLRQQFAPGKPAWNEVETTVREVMQTTPD
jgi:nicotinate dehydrogenase subunit B